MTSSNNNGLDDASKKAQTALLLIDVINDLNFDGGENLLTHALPMANNLSVLKRRAKAAGVPAIYVNDNFGRWRSDFKKLVRHCLEPGARGRSVVTHLTPEEDDYFVLKPKHSAFFQTNLEILLDHLGTTTLIFAGIATDICVLFSANDAYMRDFEIIIPSDCVASEEAEANRQALMLMQHVLKAKIMASRELDFKDTKVSFPQVSTKSGSD